MEELLLGLDYEILQKGKTEIEFKGMEYDSRKIKDGDIFVALEGSISDGHKYIKQLQRTYYRKDDKDEIVLR